MTNNAELIDQARERSQRLIAELETQQADLVRRMPRATAGAQAMQNVIDALRRTAAALGPVDPGTCNDRRNPNP